MTSLSKTVRALATPAVGLAAGLVAGLATPAVAEVRRGEGWGFPPDVSLDGHRIDWLINSTMLFVVILFVIMCAWIALACIKHGKAHVATYEHGDGKKSVTVALGLSALIFFVVDGNLFYHSVKDLDEAFWNFETPESDPRTVRIEINARQWGWDARYPGPDGTFNTPDDAVTFNDVRIPVGVPVYLQLAATDVIHSLYLPNFRQKMDAIPGTVTRLWFQATETGEFDVACAQHCGVNHYLMKAKLTVLEPAAYESWLSQATAISQLDFDAADTASQWGWAWQEK